MSLSIDKIKDACERQGCEVRVFETPDGGYRINITGDQLSDLVANAIGNELDLERLTATHQYNITLKYD